MRRQLFYGVTLVLSTLMNGAWAADDEVKDVDHESTSFALAVMDLVMQHHIDPPTRQEMILAGTKALYRADNRLPPKGLSSRVSELAQPAEITEYLQKVCAEFDKLPDAKMTWIQGALQSVPGYAYLIDAPSGKIQRQLAANRYVGTGIALTMNKAHELPAISKVFLDGPAWRAGIRANDLILEIEGEATASKQLKQIVEELRGETGSEVTFVVRQPDADESRTLTVTRGRVFIPTVEGHHEISEGRWAYTIDGAQELAYVRFKSIGPSTLHELRQVEEKLRQEPEQVRGIVLDLRSGGGILHDLVMVADGLLDGGIIGHVRSLDSVKTYEANPGALFQDLPMVVLIGEFANADRVFLTAALQDNGRALIVGRPTTSETYVGQLVPLPGRDEFVRIAVGVMQRGNGTPLLKPQRGRFGLELSASLQHLNSSAAGRKRAPFIAPDHVVAAAKTLEEAMLDKVSVKQLADAMLDKAIEVLRAEIEGRSTAPNPNVSG